MARKKEETGRRNDQAPRAIFLDLLLLILLSGLWYTDALLETMLNLPSDAAPVALHSEAPNNGVLPRRGHAPS